MRQTATLLLPVFVFAAMSATAQAQTIHYVDDNAPPGGDGLSWATAYDTLPPALTAAQPGDQIWVAAGTYIGNFTLALEVEMYGGFAGTETELTQRDWTINETILDGNKAGTVVTGPTGATEATRIDGFTIQNGTGTVSDIFTHGGGIHLDGSSPTIANNTVTANVATHGGGLYLSNSSPAFTSNTVVGNTGWQGGGAGLYLINSSPTIVGNTITGNHAGSYSGGGGMNIVESSPTLDNNTITDNAGSTFGGGLKVSNSSVIITNNVIQGNSGTAGSGIWLSGSSGTINNNTITDNVGVGAGGGLAIYWESSLIIEGNTISGNTTGQGGGGGIFVWDSSPTIRNNTITNNSTGPGGGESARGEDASPRGIGHRMRGGWPGAGLNIEGNSSPIVVGNVISGNNSYELSGGVEIAVDGSASPTVVGNTITGNTAGHFGGGMRVRAMESASAIVANNLIVGNSAIEYHAGGLSATGASTIANNTVIGNTAGGFGGGLYVSDLGSPTITNTIIAFNSSGVYGYDDANPALRANCVFGNTEYDYSGLPDPTGTDGNISEAPSLIRNPDPGPDGQWGTEDDDYGDVRLSSDSSCIDAGDKADVPADAADLDGDGNTTEPIPLDLDGWLRFVDDVRTPDTGTGTPPVVDMGAYEFQDCNDNGIPDHEDIAAGTSQDCASEGYPDECERDCNSNGTADSCDILEGTATDNNANAVPDECDVWAPSGEDRLGMACTTDEQCGSPGAVCAQGKCYVLKNRYISIDPNPANDGLLTARRVSLFDSGEQTFVLGWVGEPIELSIAGPETTPQLLARIETSPYYRDWSVDNLGQPWVSETLHIGDCETSPGSTYAVQSIVEGIDINDEANYTAPLMLPTVSDFGDVVGATTGAPPDGVRNFKDISAAVRGFQSIQTEPKVWLDLQGGTATPEIPNFSDISFADINQAVSGFQGGAYPFPAPCDCPGQSCP